MRSRARSNTAKTGSEHRSRVKAQSTYFIKERNLLKWLSVILVPLVIGIIVALFDKSFAIWLPSFSMYQCGNWKGDIEAYHKSIDTAISTFTNTEFIVCSIFFVFTFYLRNINDEFSIGTEIRAVTTLLFVSDFCYIATLILFYDTVFTILGFIQYIEVILCISLLYLTAIRPIQKTYKPNPIIPFPLTQDCVESLESAMMMPTSS